MILTALKRIGLAPSISTTGSVKARLMLSRDQAAELLEVRPTLWWRGESTANSSLKLGADSGRVMDDSGIVKRCFALEFRRKLSSLPWQPARHSDN